MKIQVLGSGCPTCKKLLEAAKKAAEELNIDTEVEYVTDISKIVEIGIMTSPVLAVDGKPVLMGGGKSVEEIKNVLQTSLSKDNNAAGGCCCGCKC